MAGDYDSIIQDAEVFYQKGDYRSALRLYDQAIAIDASKKTAYSYAMDACAGINDLDGMARYAMALLTKFPNDDTAISALGYVNAQRGNSKIAMDYYNQAIALNPNVAFTWGLRGTLKASLSMNEDAIADFSESIRLRPDAPTSYINRAEVYYKKGLNDKALIDLQQALKIAPNDERAKSLMGKISNVQPPTSISQQAGQSASSGLSGNNDPDFITGKDLVSKRDYRAAIDSLKRALNSNPRNASVLSYLSDCYFYLKDYDSAIYYAQKTLEVKPEETYSYSQIGMSQKVKGDMEGALLTYNNAISKYPESFLYAGRGYLYIDLGRYEEAIADISKSIQLSPNNSAYRLYERGKAYAGLKQTEKAIQDLEAATAADPALSEAKLLLDQLKGGRAAPATGAQVPAPSAINAQMGGQVDDFKKGVQFFDNGEYKSAIDQFKKAMMTMGNPEQAYYYIARSYYRLKDSFNTSQYAKKLQETAPNNPDAYNLMGLASMEDKEYNKAIDLFTEAIKRDPKVATFYDNRGEAYYRQGFYNKAIAEYGLALETDSKDRDALRGRADCYIAMNQLSKAIYDLKVIVAGDPKDSDTLKLLDALQNYDKGIELFDKNDNKAAMDYFLKTVVFLPNNQQAIYYVGRTYYRLDEIERCLEYMKKLLKLNPDHADGHNLTGLCYSANKDFTKAITEFNEAIRINSKDAVFFTNRAIAYRDAKQYEDALKDFTAAIGLNPKYIYAWAGRAETYIAQEKKTEAYADLQQALKIDPHNATVKRLLSKRIGRTITEEEERQGLTQFSLVEVPKETFADVAGMDTLKEELRKAIIYPFKHPDLSKEYGIKAGGGVLLYGPPGCGKTYIIKATAGEAKANLIDAKISDVMGVWVGTTEKNIANLFQLARDSAPAILFVDELDALGGSRDVATNSVQRQAANTFLTELDGLSSSNENILIVGATNVPWLIDPAMKRSGRFGSLIYVPPPDDQGRKDMFKQYLKGKPVDEAMDYDALSKDTLFYSAADIAAICAGAAKLPWEEAIKTGNKRKISMADVTAMMAKIKPTLPAWYESARTAATMMRDQYPDLAADLEKYDKKKGESNMNLGAYR